MTLEARLLEWGEAWARARELWRETMTGLFDDGFTVMSWHPYGTRTGLEVWVSDRTRWQLTPLQFWLWAHTVDSKRTDSQRCPDCAHRGGPMEWRLEPVAEELGVPVYQAAARRQAEGWSVASYAATGVHMSRPCPTCTRPAVECEQCDGSGEAATQDPRYMPGDCPKCSGRQLHIVGLPSPTRPRGTIPGKSLGYTVRPLARVVCEAMPREPSECPREHCYDDITCSRGWLDKRECESLRGDPAARGVLDFHADDLQGEGDPLGQALALWLHGVPCEACDEKCAACGWHGRYGHKTGCSVSDKTGPCEACHGDGTALGAYVAAQIEAEAQRIEAARESAYRTAFRQQLQCEPH